MSKRGNRITKISSPKEESIKQKHYISFGFKHLQEVSYTDCKGSDLFVKFLKRLKQLSTLEWKTIDTSNRHSFGYEPISISSIKKSTTPLGIEISSLNAFRATGDNHAFLGFRDGDVFQIVFIEAEFGDIYSHG